LICLESPLLLMHCCRVIKREEKRAKTKPKIRIETKSESERVAGPRGGPGGRGAGASRLGGFSGLAP
jgi:hypothetical protein